MCALCVCWDQLLACDRDAVVFLDAEFSGLAPSGLLSVESDQFSSHVRAVLLCT